ncbi:MAG: alcohol dehydrogenase, partial [Desulfobacterales bacterium CG23_combo_of_CG06-09_8_20_14_all_51_8]
MLPDFFEFYNPTKVVYETGVATDLKPELDIIGIKKYFIVSDHVIDGLGLVQKVAD